MTTGWFAYRGRAGDEPVHADDQDAYVDDCPGLEIDDVPDPAAVRRFEVLQACAWGAFVPPPEQERPAVSAVARWLVPTGRDSEEVWVTLPLASDQSVGLDVSHPADPRPSREVPDLIWIRCEVRGEPADGVLRVRLEPGYTCEEGGATVFDVRGCQVAL